ncbi:hypothetical protein [Lacisediminimonas profundi]|uniref:hypothetical protein n=1 Tax=Lacisediminimonas profundi TaxID=2603856 RepID=UPI00124B32C7|nr:hypothetical protein [Lacisediminimonas profundi]
MKHFTIRDLRQEICGYMVGLANVLERVYLPDSGFGLMGLDKKELGVDRISDVPVDRIDIDRLRVTSTLCDLYDYGINGIRSQSLSDWSDAEDTINFVDGLSSFPLLEENADFDIRLSSYVTKIAHARHILDSEDGVTDMQDSIDQADLLPTLIGIIKLHDIALLAGMDEKSVRNAANPKVKNHLKTFNHGNGTYARVEDAREWLASRRGFKPTVEVDKTLDRDLPQIGFSSGDDLAHYLEGRLASKNLSPDTAGTKIPWVTTAKIVDLKMGKFEFNKDELAALAALLELDSKAFVLATFALHQKLERLGIEQALERL